MKNQYYKQEQESLEAFERFGNIIMGITLVLLIIFVIMNVYKFFNN